ncbi:MAG TPA: hypothetical protein VLE49_00220 [Anaerolineales bacterium]|nr:hypothetical protein [Anaerolineales bacterium]
MTSRKTRACTLETLDESLKAAIRAHGAKYELRDIESDILMCCETISVQQKKGLFGGIKTTLSAVYVTPKWLVWVESSEQNDAGAGTAQLKHIDVRDYRTTASYPIMPDQGLNVTGRYTDKTKTGIKFIMLDSEADGQKFRQVLDEALRKATHR